MKIVLIVVGAAAGTLAVMFLAASIAVAGAIYRMYESIGRNNRDVVL